MMSMGGKRFGAGIAGGLLLGLLIVGGSGFASGLYGSFTAAGAQNAVAMSSTYQTNSSVSSSSSMTYAVSTTSGPYSPNSTSYGSASSTVTSVSSSVATEATTSLIPQSAASNAANAAPWYFGFASLSAGANGGSNQAAASRLNAIASQPVALNGLVLLPLLIAVFLGAILYRASSGKKESPGSELKDE